ncbi:MAG: response regulator [Pseudomonadales bacterium]
MTPVVESDPRVFLDRFRSDSKFDLLILDMHMPEMDGCEVARTLRADADQLPPMLLLSSLGDGDSDGDEGVLFDSTISKPVRLGQLAEAMSELFDGEAHQHAAARLEDHAMYSFRVLVAEDNLVNQKVAQGFLKHLGMRAEIAADGQEAVEMVIAQRYDVVFMDVQMPGIDGLEATRLIRELDVPQPHIIAMTANVMEDDRRICLEVGMNDFIAKPINTERLTDALNRVPGL